MKYQVYAALIASASAGPHADQINRMMPTEAETQQAEQKIEAWLADAEDIKNQAIPFIEERNRRIERAYYTHEENEAEIFEEGVGHLKQTKEETKNDLMAAQAEFEQKVTDEGIKADWDRLVQDVQTEMDSCNMDMKRIRFSVRSLRSRTRAATNLSMSSEFHENAPTPQEVEEAEEIIKGWFERGEKIMEDAQPGL